MALIDKDKLATALESKQFPEEAVTGLEYDGKAVVVAKQPGKPVKQKRHQKTWWPEEKRIEAATLYAAIGNIKRTADLAKVPYATLQRWVDEEWFLQILQRVKREENFETDRKFTSIVDKALAKLEERIEEGDYIYDIKRGMAVAVPMSGRDLSIVTGTLFDKRQLLRGEATQIKSAATNEEHLKELATKFAEYVKSREKVVSTLGATERSESDAIQVGSTTEMDVGEQASDGQTMAIGNTQGQETPEKSS